MLRVHHHPAIIADCTAAILRLVSMAPSVGFPAAARDAILAWYATSGRRLAFRRTTDPYAVLVSEAMAQQTQAGRAAEHWERFMARFPTVADLASANPADVQRAWRGLGYNRRALALWRAARAVQSEHDGNVPDSVKVLETLPGVGPYTARAIAALAFGRPVGAVDVNVRRVLGRIVSRDHDAISRAELQTVADKAVPVGRAAEWTHAVMDIGATLCRPRRPRCEECPARPWCRYGAGGRRSADDAAQTQRRRPARAAFPSTNRWLRGRILDILRAAPDDRWIAIEAPIGMHDRARVRGAADALVVDGLIEIDRQSIDPDAIRARLATS
jgi:A/G-specific adenine glycosylase